MSINLKLITDLAGIHECENLQKNVWGFSDLSIVPHHLVLTTIHSGGILVGAYDQNELIGFAYSIPALEMNSSGLIETPKHCSLMAGVKAEYRSQGVGYLLKQFQRKCVIDQNIMLITWTFDPLQALNAHFNFAKLGAICRTYTPDLYGDMRDEINKGMPTDRFTVEWWIGSNRVLLREREKPRTLDLNNIDVVNRVELVDSTPTNTNINLKLDSEELLVEIPVSIGKIKTEGFEAALQWRTDTRSIFGHYLKQGYIVTDVLTDETSKDRRLFYLLAKRDLSKILMDDPYED